MRIVFAIISFVSALAVGKMRCRRMAKRVRMLREIELFLKLMRPRTEYLHESISKTIAVLSENVQLSELEFLKVCAKECAAGRDFPVAWAKSLGNIPLKRSESELLLSFGKVVSSANSADISSIISLYETSFETSTKEAVRVLESDSKMCMSIFSAIGILFGIIIV